MTGPVQVMGQMEAGLELYGQPYETRPDPGPPAPKTQPDLCLSSSQNQRVPADMIFLRTSERNGKHLQFLFFLRLLKKPDC